MGFSNAVVFTAASMNGGTSHTVRYAQKMNRPIGFFYEEISQWVPNDLNRYCQRMNIGTVLNTKSAIEKFSGKL